MPKKTTLEKPPSKHLGRVEIRYMPDGTVDEIVVVDEHGRCVLHLEVLNKHDVFVMLYAEDEKRETAVSIGTKKESIRLREVKGWGSG